MLKTYIIEHQDTIRLSFFLAIFIMMATWELIAPKRKLVVSKTTRWLNNIGLVVLNASLVRFVVPVAATAMAAIANENNWGILNYFSIPEGISILIAIVVMDFFIWLQHVMTHAIPTLWRLHRVHHADLDFDVTTGTRFHPLEIILSAFIKLSIILLLGPPVIAVVLFEIILNGMAMFNHSNIHIPSKIDRIIRWVWVTPDMHRVHHSVEEDETNSNFGFHFSLWDRLFGTYRAQPRAGQLGMTIGIHHFTDMKQVSWISGLLLLPFNRKNNGYTINRRNWNENDE